MSKSTSPYPMLSADGTGTGVVSHAGATVVLRAAEKTGLTSRLSEALAPWRKPLATHDPGKIIADLAVAVVIGGDCLADINQLRADPAVFGQVASDPTVSRLISTLADDAPAALSAITTARAGARAACWSAAGTAAPDHDVDVDDPMILDLDATLVTAHSEKEDAAPTYKRGFGFHPLCAFVDHGSEGTGEPLAIELRPGNAGANTAADHIAVTAAALEQLPQVHGYRVGKSVLVRTDSAGGTHDFLNYLHKRRLAYSVGFGLTEPIAEAIESGARALFGEKYGDEVRVVSMGAPIAGEGGRSKAFSVELCGGTHVGRTGDIALFKIVQETGVAAGVRRIEALTGEAARQYLLAQAGVARSLAQSFKVQTADVPARVDSLTASVKSLEKQVAELKKQLALGGGSGAASAPEEINGVKHPFDDRDELAAALEARA